MDVVLDPGASIRRSGRVVADAAAARPDTKLFWIETPSNPLVAVTDLARVAEIARAAGKKTEELLEGPGGTEGGGVVVHKDDLVLSE